MRTIWKYSISMDGPQTIHVPKGAKLLHIGEQRGVITIWFELDPSLATEDRCFCVYGTGWDIPDDPGEYAGTVYMDPFVWHVYETKVIGA